MMIKQNPMWYSACSAGDDALFVTHVWMKTKSVVDMKRFQFDSLDSDSWA